MREVKIATAANVMVLLLDSADHVTGKTGLAPAAAISKNGGAFAAITPVVTERGNGWYSVALAAADTDTLGDLVVRATAAGADPGERVLNVVANVEADTKASADAAARPADVTTAKDAVLAVLQDASTGLARLDAEIDALPAAVQAAIPTAVIPVLQGAAWRDVTPTTTIVQVRQGETVSIPYDLGADYVGYTPWFGARLGVDSATYAIAPRAVREVTDRTGFIDLAPVDLATLGNLSGELEIRKDSDPTQILKPCAFVLQVKKAVIR